VVNAVSLSIHAIGAGLAGTAGLNTKHAIKQVDRLLSNSALRLWTLLADWVPYVLGARKEIVVALDWTEFDADGHATIALYLVTSHGRATPLVWKTVKKASLAPWCRSCQNVLMLALQGAGGHPPVKTTFLRNRPGLSRVSAPGAPWRGSPADTTRVPP